MKEFEHLHLSQKYKDFNSRLLGNLPNQIPTGNHYMVQPGVLEKGRPAGSFLNQSITSKNLQSDIEYRIPVRDKMSNFVGSTTTPYININKNSSELSSLTRQELADKIYREQEMRFLTEKKLLADNNPQGQVGQPKLGSNNKKPFDIMDLVKQKQKQKQLEEKEQKLQQQQKAEVKDDQRPKRQDEYNKQIQTQCSRQLDMQTHEDCKTCNETTGLYVQNFNNLEKISIQKSCRENHQIQQNINNQANKFKNLLISNCNESNISQVVNQTDSTCVQTNWSVSNRNNFNDDPKKSLNQNEKIKLQQIQNNRNEFKNLQQERMVIQNKILKKTKQEMILRSSRNYIQNQGKDGSNQSKLQSEEQVEKNRRVVSTMDPSIKTSPHEKSLKDGLHSNNHEKSQIHSDVLVHMDTKNRQGNNRTNLGICHLGAGLSSQIQVLTHPNKKGIEAKDQFIKQINKRQSQSDIRKMEYQGIKKESNHIDNKDTMSGNRTANQIQSFNYSNKQYFNGGSQMAQRVKITSRENQRERMSLFHNNSSVGHPKYNNGIYGKAKGATTTFNQIKKKDTILRAGSEHQQNMQTVSSNRKLGSLLHQSSENYSSVFHEVSLRHQKMNNWADNERQKMFNKRKIKKGISSRISSNGYTNNMKDELNSIEVDSSLGSREASSDDESDSDSIEDDEIKTDLQQSDGDHKSDCEIGTELDNCGENENIIEKLNRRARKRKIKSKEQKAVNIIKSMQNLKRKSKKKKDCDEGGANTGQTHKKANCAAWGCTCQVKHEKLKKQHVVKKEPQILSSKQLPPHRDYGNKKTVKSKLNKIQNQYPRLARWDAQQQLKVKQGIITKEEYFKAREEQFAEFSDVEEEQNEIMKLEKEFDKSNKMMQKLKTKNSMSNVYANETKKKSTIDMLKTAENKIEGEDLQRLQQSINSNKFNKLRRSLKTQSQNRTSQRGIQGISKDIIKGQIDQHQNLKISEKNEKQYDITKKNVLGERSTSVIEQTLKNQLNKD